MAEPVLTSDLNQLRQFAQVLAQVSAELLELNVDQPFSTAASGLVGSDIAAVCASGGESLRVALAAISTGTMMPETITNN
ncbi:MAG: hypothetical protein ACRCSF_11125 [Mycobacteriaceae bacterium]